MRTRPIWFLSSVSNKSYKNSKVECTICQRLFFILSVHKVYFAHGPLVFNHRFVTKLRVTAVLQRVPKLTAPQSSGGEWLSVAAQAALANTPSCLSAPLPKVSASPSTSFTLSGYHGASLWRLADVRPYDPSLPSEPSGSAGGSSADGDWAPPGPSVHGKQHDRQEFFSLPP